MKPSFIGRAFYVAVLFFSLTTGRAHAGFLSWTNTLGGSWFDPFGWSPNGVPGATDAAFITNNGTYTVYAPTGIVSTAVFKIGGGTGKQTFVYGSATGGQLFMTNSSVEANGVLIITNSGLTGNVFVKQGAELRFNSSFGLQLYNLAVTNQGTMTWSNGSLTVGGNNNQYTYVTNSGLWQIMGDFSMGSGGGNPSICDNSGLIKKVAGANFATFGINVVNLPSGVVDCASGTLKLAPNSTNFLSGSFVAEVATTIIYEGNESDAGAALSGAGSHQFTFGNFYFRTSTIPNLQLAGGDLYIIGKTTFQNAGAITNLTLDGAVLHGTNRISGSLTVNSGNMVDQMTVLPTGQLNLSMPVGTQFYGLNLFNQGAVNWSSGAIAVGTTIISNGGTWTITGDATMSNGGSPASLTNSGTIQKTSGTGISVVGGVNFINQPSGVIRVASGTMQLPNNYTNFAGELQLVGGTFTTFPGTIYMTGGKVDGFGTFGSPVEFDGGVLAPGPLSGIIQFQSSVMLGTNLTLMLDGTGTIPGSQYDQLSVAGALTISNCTLQVSSLPSVPGGTSFVIITNTGAAGTIGTFNGLPENASLSISGQPFHIHYSGGSGNDLVLVRDSLSGTGPAISSGGYSNKIFQLLGSGSGSTIYTIQASTNFLQWSNIGTATGDLSGHFNFSDTNAQNFRYRFYRTTN